jgi:hypothetical protein
VAQVLDKDLPETLEVERGARAAAERVRAMDAALAGPTGAPHALVKRHVYSTIILALACLDRSNLHSISSRPVSVACALWRVPLACGLCTSLSAAGQ